MAPARVSLWADCRRRAGMSRDPPRTLAQEVSHLKGQSPKPNPGGRKPTPGRGNGSQQRRNTPDTQLKDRALGRSCPPVIPSPLCLQRGSPNPGREENRSTHWGKRQREGEKHRHPCCTPEPSTWAPLGACQCKDRTPREKGASRRRGTRGRKGPQNHLFLQWGTPTGEERTWREGLAWNPRPSLPGSTLQPGLGAGAAEGAAQQVGRTGGCSRRGG